MHKTFLIIAAIYGALAVMLGAFGAHSLKDKLDISQLQVFETAVRYQFYHVFALVLAALIASRWPMREFNFAAWCFIVGILLFSGSLYLLSTRELFGISNWKWLGPITPLGGLAFIAGWIGLLLGFLKTNH